MKSQESIAKNRVQKQKTDDPETGKEAVQTDTKTDVSDTQAHRHLILLEAAAAQTIHEARLLPVEKIRRNQKLHKRKIVSSLI